jgi:hypothetical protein
LLVKILSIGAKRSENVEKMSNIAVKGGETANKLQICGLHKYS